jgi:hypothetical protein
MPADVLESRHFQVPTKHRVRETTATRLHDVEHLLASLLKKVDKMHADVTAALAAQDTEIARMQTLEQQNKALLEGLSAMIQAGGNPAEIAAAIATRTATVKTSNDGTAANITANQPPV